VCAHLRSRITRGVTRSPVKAVGAVAARQVSPGTASLEGAAVRLPPRHTRAVHSILAASEQGAQTGAGWPARAARRLSGLLGAESMAPRTTKERVKKERTRSGDSDSEGKPSTEAVVCSVVGSSAVSWNLVARLSASKPQKCPKNASSSEYGASGFAKHVGRAISAVAHAGGTGGKRGEGRCQRHRQSGWDGRQASSRRGSAELGVSCGGVMCPSARCGGGQAAGRPAGGAQATGKL